MKINGVNIEGKEALHEYYSFKAVWQIIETCPDAYWDMLDKFIDQGSMGLPGYQKRSLVDSRICAALEFMTGKRKNCPIIISQWLKQESQGSKLRKVDGIELKKQIDQLNQDFWENNTSSIEELLMEKEDFCFSDRTAAIFYLFLLLHIQAGRNIGEVLEDRKRGGNHWKLEELNRWNSLDYMKRYLRKEGIADYMAAVQKKKALEISLPDGIENFPLPCRKGTEREMAFLEPVKIINKGSAPLMITLEGSSIQRQLYSSEWVYVLREGERYVNFLPRFAVTEKKCLLLSNGKLILKENGIGSKIPGTEMMEPIVWSYDEGDGESVGLFAVDREGKLFVRGREPITTEKKAVSVSVYYDTYGILLEDGGLLTSPWGISKEKCEQLIGIYVGLNNSAAIRKNRTLVLSDPSMQEQFAQKAYQVMEVCVYDEHLLWLDMNGCAHTEQDAVNKWLEERTPVLAAGICKKGYIIASDCALYKIPFHPVGENEIEPWKTTGSPIMELAVSDEMVVFRMMNDDKLYSFSFKEELLEMV